MHYLKENIQLKDVKQGESMQDKIGARNLMKSEILHVFDVFHRFGVRETMPSFVEVERLFRTAVSPLFVNLHNTQKSMQS